MTSPSTTDAPPPTPDPGKPGRSTGKRAAVLRALGVLAVIGIWLGIASVGGPAIGSLSSVQSNDQQTFLPSGAESVLAADAAKGFTKSNSLPAFVIFSTPEKTTPEQLKSWQGFAAALPSTPITSGKLPADAPGTVGDYLIKDTPITVVPSADGKAALVVVPLDANVVNKIDSAGKAPLGAVVDTIRASAVAQAAGGQAHITGPAGLIADLGTAFAGIDGILLFVALGAVLIILFLVYRAIALPFVVLFTSISALALGGGVVYLLADNDVIKLNGQSQGILFILVVGAATDYGLLLVSRYREELERTEDKYTAIKRAWRACVEPIAASAGTVIIGLLCLLLSDLNSNKSLGPIGAIGIAAALIGALTLLPALLMGGRWLFWPRVPRPPKDAAAAAKLRKPGLWARVAAFVGRYPRRIWITTAIILGVLCLAVPTLKASGIAQTDVFLKKVDSVAGNQQLIEHFPGGSGNPVVIIAPAQSQQEVLTALKTVPGLAPDPIVVTAPQTGPVKPTDPLVVGGKIQIQATPSAASDSDAAEQLVRDVRSTLHALPDGGQILVGGNTAIQLDTLDTSRHDLKIIIPAILLAVLLVLILLLRALVAPLLLVAATVLSFGTALGVSALVFNHVLDFPGADPAVPLFAFVFLVALGIDYSIFLMTRAREETALHGSREGVLRALSVTGGVITSAGVVLATTFAALAVIPILFLAQIAFIVAFGVLLDTLVVRTLLVPALSVDIGKKIWWPITPKPTKHQLEHQAELAADREAPNPAAEPARS